MFAIALEEKQYSTYILSDDTTDSCIEVVPERGGIVTRWQVQGQEILYLDTERFKNPEMSVRGGIPILFPICGNVVGDTYTYEGQQYTLKQHGFARNLPWTVTGQEATADKAAITIQLTSNDETLAVYPFEFEVEFTYTLKGNNLEIFQRFKNLSQKVMPFSTGLHTYFLTQDKTQLQFEIPAVQYQAKDSETSEPFTGTFDPEIDEIDVMFSSLTGLAAFATDNSRKFKVATSYSAAYGHLVFWMLKGKDFYCLEPWSAPRNAMQTGEDMINLKPGESYEMVLHMNTTFFE